MGSQEMSGKATAKKAWFILNLETTDRAVRQQRNILINSYPYLPIEEAANTFSMTIHETFNKMGDLHSGEGYMIKCLFIIGRDGRELATNPMQIIAFLQALPSTGHETRKPDLFGLGTNRVRVEFGEINVFDRLLQGRHIRF